MEDREWTAVLLARNLGWLKYACSVNWRMVAGQVIVLWLVAGGIDRSKGSVWDGLLLLCVLLAMLTAAVFVYRIFDYFVWKRPLVNKCERSGWFARGG